MEMFLEWAVALCALLSTVATVTYYSHEVRHAKLFAFMEGKGIFICNFARHPVMVRFVLAEQGTLLAFWEKDASYQYVPGCTDEVRERVDMLLLPGEKERLDYALCLNGEPCEAVAVVKNVRPFSRESVDIVLRPLPKKDHDARHTEAENAQSQEKGADGVVHG